jgi:hypothetical protein
MGQQNDNEVARFFQNPVFKINEDPDTGELVFDSQLLQYRITTMPAKSDDLLHTYIQFANWYAQLNSVTKPGSTPPFPRMAVNDNLQARGLIPTEIEFTATNPARIAATRSITLRSVHDVEWKLFGEDLRRIEETGRQMAAFAEVTPQKYLQPAEGPGGQAQNAGKPLGNLK